MIPCPLCNITSDTKPRTIARQFVSCPKCGEYQWGNIVYKNLKEDEDKLYKVSSWIREQNDLYNEKPIITIDKFESIVAMREKRIQEQFYLIL